PLLMIVADQEQRVMRRIEGERRAAIRKGRPVELSWGRRNAPWYTKCSGSTRGSVPRARVLDGARPAGIDAGVRVANTGGTMVPVANHTTSAATASAAAPTATSPERPRSTRFASDTAKSPRRVHSRQRPHGRFS